MFNSIVIFSTVLTEVKTVSDFFATRRLFLAPFTLTDTTAETLLLILTMIHKRIITLSFIFSYL
jgi:hypothetical protein